MDHSEKLTDEERQRVEQEEADDRDREVIESTAEELQWWHYDELPSKAPYNWEPSVRGDSEWDSIDFHIDLGCGKHPKARLGIDRFWAPGVGLLMDLESLSWQSVEQTAPQAAIDVAKRGYQLCQHSAGMLPFPDESIESIVSHHALEHIGGGFLHLMDEIWRVIVPGGVVRIITPLFPSTSAVEDPDHKRYFTEDTFDTFCGGANGEHWHESFSTPYTDCRFELVDKDITPPPPPEKAWGPGGDDIREIRVALRKWA